MIEWINRLRHDGRGVDAAAVVAGLALLIAALGSGWDGWPGLPIAVRLLTGLIAFGVAPGLLMCGPFFSDPRRRVGTADFVVSVITCSFSCNLAFNIVLFWLETSMDGLTRAYVFLQLAGYVLWGVWRWRRGRPAISMPVATPRVSWLRVAAWASLGAAACAVVYISYTTGSPITNSEEMVVLRKLVENPSVRYDNLSYRAGDPSTYIFVPFQILIGGTSLIAQIDVALVYSMFFAVTTGLSMLMIAALLYAISGREDVAGLAVLWMLGIALFDPDSVIYGSGIIVAFPNRYGFAGGVLLPLILLLFWSVLREPGFRLWRWALLVYIATEMTFVHARETLLALGAMVSVFVLLAARPKIHRGPLLRIAAVVMLTGLVLIGYKRVNLAISPDLDAYVTATTEASRVALGQLISDNAPLNLLTVAVPRSTQVSVHGSEPVTLGFSTYRAMFVDTWQFGFLGRLYLPVVLLILPLFAVTARSLAELSTAVVLAALALITSSGLLNLAISAVVGSPEVLIVYNIVALFSVLVLCLAVWNLASTLTRPFGTGAIGFRLRDRPDAGPGKLLGVATSTQVALAAGGAMLILGITKVDRLIALRTELHALWTDRFGAILLLVTIGAIIVRIRRRDLPLFAPEAPGSRPAAFLAACLISVLLIPAVMRTNAWKSNLFAPPFPSHDFTGDLIADYPMLVEPRSKKLDPADYPLDLIRFLRERVPPNQTLVASDALALLERVPHFTAVLSNKGEVAPHFIVNSVYLRDYSRTGPDYAMAPYLTSDEGVELLGRMLAEFRVDLMVIDPDESDAFRAARDRSALLRASLEPVFDSGGYVIYAVRNRPVAAAQQ